MEEDEFEGEQMPMLYIHTSEKYLQDRHNRMLNFTKAVRELFI